ncbi:MAG TPA: phage tail tape measure protein, partial [Candidatus Omnitrophota bacterium]|nr:phage tail tape measure protein [Candidatus Omnitrophota bacterium]
MASGRAIKAGQAYVELFADNTKLVRGLNAAQGRIAAFGSAIQGIGMRMTAMAAAVAAPAAISLKTFAEFEDEMARVRAVTGATDAEFQSLYETAKRLGATTTFSAVQVAQGVRALGSAGLEAHEILAAIPSTLHLARVGVMEIGEAANIVEDVGSAFGLAADQVGRIVDTLATTQARGNAAAREMSQGLRSVAPIATTAGQSLEMVAAAIDVLADRGVDAASAGTDLARILTNLATPDVQQALEGMGVATVDAAGGMRSLGAVMADLGRATAAMPDSRQLDLFDAMFGRSRRSAIVLAQHAGALAHLHGALLAASGAGATMAAIMENTLGGSMRALLSALQAVQIAFGEALVDDIRKAVGGLTGFARQVANLVAANRDVVVSFARWAAAFGLIGVGLVTVGLALHTAAAGIGGVLIPAQLLAGLLATMAGLFAALLSPVGLVAVAVAGVGGALTDLSRLGGTVLTWLTQRFKDLSTAAVQAFEGIADALAAGDITLAVRVLWAGIKAEFAGGTNWLLVQWADVRAGVLKILEGTIQGALAAWESMVHGFAVAWIEGVAILKRVWAHFAGWHQ